MPVCLYRLGMPHGSFNDETVLVSASTATSAAGNHGFGKILVTMAVIVECVPCVIENVHSMQFRVGRRHYDVL